MNIYLKYIIILYLILIIILLLKINNEFTILFEPFVDENDNTKPTIDISSFVVDLSVFNDKFGTKLKELPYRIAAVGIDSDSFQKIYIYNKPDSLYLNRTIEYWMTNIHDSLNKTKYYFIICYNDSYKFDETLVFDEKIWVSFAPDYKNDYRVFAFAKRIDDEKTICIPDPYYTFNNGHSERLETIDKNFINWSYRTNKCVWRGNPNFGLNTNFFDPRNKDDLNPRQYFINLIKEDKIKNFSYDETYMEIKDQIRYKYILDIDGWTNTWDATVWKLYSGSVLLKVKSPWKQWYYDDLQEFFHYVPVENDFSNLNDQIEWCMNNEDKCKIIIENARLFVLNNLNWTKVKNKTIENVINVI